MMTNRSGLRLIFAALVIAAIVGIALRMYLPMPREGTVMGILTDEPCAPPCWQGITPGTVVNHQTILRQLRRMPGTTSVRRDGNAVKWLWADRPGVNAIYIGVDDVVQSISLQVDFELTVGDIIRKYGPPDAVNAAPFGYGEDTYVLLNLFYPRHGLTCRVRVVPHSHPVLKPHSVVYEVTYSTTAESVEAWFGDKVEDMCLYPWPGYGELEIPCPQQ